MFLSEAIHCKTFAIHYLAFAECGFITGLTRCRQSHDFFFFFLACSLDPSGLLDIASFICSCVFSVVNVRQSEGEHGNPLLPRGI